MNKKRSKEGSISLEAALLLPLCIIVIVLFTQITAALNIEINLRAAMDAASREAGLAMATAGLWEDRPQTVVDFLSAESGIDLPAALDEWILELAFGQAGGNYLMSRVNHYYESDTSYPALSQNILSDASMTLRISDSESLIWMDLDYELQLVGIRLKRQIRQPAVLWHALPKIEEEIDAVPEDIWSSDNFSRGLFFRAYFGSNLPDNYPVFSIFEHGHATLISSIDITAPSYVDEENLIKNIRKDIDRIAAYDDPGALWRNNPVKFTSADIHTRSLLLVIPTNARDGFQDVLNEIRLYAREQNVNIKLRRAGFSKRYL